MRVTLCWMMPTNFVFSHVTAFVQFFSSLMICTSLYRAVQKRVVDSL